MANTFPLTFCVSIWISPIPSQRPLPCPSRKRPLCKQKTSFEHKRSSDCLTSRNFQVPPGFGPGNEGFADLCLTTWLWHHKNGAVDETRTRDLHLGKVALYQLSYYRLWCLGAESNHRHCDFQSHALPAELPRQIWRPGRGSNPRPPA